MKNSQDDNSKKKKKGGIFDKIMMGAIIGGAIGSVLGMSIAPKKGKNTRKILKKGAQEAMAKGKKFLEEHEEEIESIKGAAREKGKKLFKFAEKDPLQNGTAEKRNLKKIPHEE